MASPDPAVVERQYYLSALGLTDDPALTIADLRSMTGGGASVKSAAELNKGIDKNVYETLLKDTSLSSVLLKSKFSPKGLVLQPLPLSGISTQTNVSLRQLEVRGDGYMWGADSLNQIQKTTDGTNWTYVATAPGFVQRILWCDDGEVLVLTGDIYKSTGWASNPATATWTRVVAKSGPVGAPGIRPWGFDGNGTKFIATEYSGADRSESRYVWVSLDKGTTWNVVLDKTTIDPTNQSHMHGACYDPWEDRFWLSHGHDAIRGVYYSNNNGTTWTKLVGAFDPDAAPTVLVATDDGIVCGSDSNYGGVYGIARSGTNNLEMKWLSRWKTEPIDGVVGQANRGVRDPDTGLVYIGFDAGVSTVAPAVAAGTAKTAAFIYDYGTVGLRRVPQTVPFKNTLYITIDNTTSVDTITGKYTLPGSVSRADEGNIQGGSSGYQTSIAIGNKAVVGGIGSVAIGTAVSTIGTDVTVIGYKASNIGSTSIAIGREAKSEASTIAIGVLSSGTGLTQTIIGHSSVGYLNGTGATTVGHSSKAGVASVAVGRLATAGVDSTIQNATAIGQQANAGQSAVAVGRSAVATHTNGVAIGANTATTVGNQVQIGSRHIEMTEQTDPGVATTDGARLFAKDNGSGKTQLCVRFQSGVSIVLATEV